MKVEYSDYEICILTEKEQKIKAIKLCDSAFEKPVFSRNNSETLISKIDKHAHFIVVCHREIVGYCAIYANDNINQTAYITLLAVRPQFQNMHIGKQLLRAASKLASDQGMKYVKLEVSSNNINAIRFYQRNGFVELCAHGKGSIYMQKTIISHEV